MKNGKTWWIIALCALALALLSGCRKADVFDGVRTANRAEFHLEYTAFNGKQTAELTLTEGDALHAVFANESGNVDVTVGLSDKKPIYTGTEQTDADFTLIIPESGDYHFSVTGHEAKGRVFFDRIPQNTK